MPLPPFNCVMNGDDSAAMVNWLNANPDVAAASPEIQRIVGWIDYMQHHPWEFVAVPIPPKPGDDPNNWPVDMQPAMWGGTRRSGDDGVPFFQPRAVTCVPIPIPVNATGRLELGVAEYRTGPTIRQGWLSYVASANPVGNLSFQEGSKVYPFVTIGGNVQAGETIYFCWRYWSSDANNGAGGPTAPEGEMQGCTYGGGWPN